jgi:sulfite exporter TauE/SafE
MDAHDAQWLLGYVLLGLVFGCAGWAMGRRRSRGGLGFILGFVFTILGLVAIAYILRKEEEDDDGPRPGFS